MEPDVPGTIRPVPDVVLDNITTILDDTAVMHRLWLEIPAGRVTVLMGPSGVGKTTLIKHVVGLLEPDGGTVRIDDRDIWDSSPDEWKDIRKGMSAMLGGSYLFSTSTFSSMTVLENLTYSLEVHGVPAELRHNRAMARLAELDLLDHVDRKPEELPAHATKRLALARALVADAPFTVLDEIDLGLDGQHSAMMLDAVRGLRERTNCTLLVTTHNLELARRLADNLAIMVNGRIVAHGPPHEVLHGIETTDDFDARFEFSDYTGPPRLDEAEASAERRRPPAVKPKSWFGVDPQWTWIALVAILVIVAFLLVARVGLF
ncbi:ATP-binding cassette domain-containing protein [Pseudonocardia spinosispora]|uniref:ATP-binding cassette domain-containing protein n=1 Tax=Pseudonocardia spinosispora TaxID=103441 RepID=UPI0012EB0FB4|nr:ATP-binding cassette domain-containing protein [Pseudonocardia spinosispora]